MKLGQHLELERCPHCGINAPNLTANWQINTSDSNLPLDRFWKAYICARCGGVVIASSVEGFEGDVIEIFPKPSEFSSEIPEAARAYLKQAIESLHAPAGSVMLSASAIDAMLKRKGYREGSLFSRIDQAAEDNLITKDMALWAHEVRLNANEPRHADEEEPLPSQEDAKKCVDFAAAFAEFLFVLPSRISRGLAEAKAK